MYYTRYSRQAPCDGVSNVAFHSRHWSVLCLAQVVREENCPVHPNLQNNFRITWRRHSSGWSWQNLQYYQSRQRLDTSHRHNHRPIDNCCRLWWRNNHLSLHSPVQQEVQNFSTHSPRMLPCQRNQNYHPRRHDVQH